MNIISVTDITKTYTERKLFEKASFYLQEREKVGVIGINGTGKSTLLKIAAGIEERDAVFARRARVVVLHAFEKGRGALPFLLLVVLQRLAVNQFGLPAFQKGVHPGASSEDDRCRHSAKGV